MKKFTVSDGAALIIWLLPAIYLWSVYSSLPNIVPVHYGFNGTVDRYGSKQEFLIGPCILMSVSVLVYLLMRFLPLIDPKKQAKVGEGTFQKLALGMVIFLAALDLAILFATTHKGFQLDKLLFPIMGLLFAFLGNIMNSIKPNYFAGVRTPWTLESEDNWRATHRLAGRIWFTGGLLLVVATLVLPAKPATVTVICTVTIMAIVPIVYSYRYFKKHQLKQDS